MTTEIWGQDTNSVTPTQVPDRTHKIRLLEDMPNALP
jgi:hypothetical protein